MLRLEIIPDNRGRFNLCEFAPELKEVPCEATVVWNGKDEYSYTKLGHIKYKFGTKEKVTVHFKNLECDNLSFRNNTRIISMDGELPRLGPGKLNYLCEGCTNLVSVTGMFFSNNRDQLEAIGVFKNCPSLIPDFSIIVDLWNCRDFTQFYYGCRSIYKLHYPLFSKTNRYVEVLDEMFAETPYLQEVRGDLIDTLWNLKSVKRMFYKSGINRTEVIFKELHTSVTCMEELYAECYNLTNVNPNYFAYLPFRVPLETKKSMFYHTPAKINY